MANSPLFQILWVIAAIIVAIYIAVMGIVIAFLVAYSTRDLWYSKRKRTEQEKSDSEFEQFLEAFIVERHSAGDVDTGEKVHG